MKISVSFINKQSEGVMRQDHQLVIDFVFYRWCVRVIWQLKIKTYV